VEREREREYGGEKGEGRMMMGGEIESSRKSRRSSLSVFSNNQQKATRKWVTRWNGDGKGKKKEFRC
jgi:hypothetical protein